MTRAIAPIVLAGPPGVGKSTVARAVAARVGTNARDLDEEVERLEGRSPAELIRVFGEERFRAAEERALEGIGPEAAVIALGGGTLTRRGARRTARARGLVFGLTADLETLRRRLGGSGQSRPLLDPRLDGRDPLEALLDARASTYATCDETVDARDPTDQVSARIVERAGALRVLTLEIGGRSTRVVVGRGLNAAVAGAVRALEPARPVLAILDRGVPAARRAALVEAIERHGPVAVREVDGGEAVKSWDALGRLLDSAVEAGCGRQSVVVGVGGGAVTDAAAMCAALLGRGAPLVLVPTTAIAQVDAAVGGKCAVNTAGARNAVGLFHPAEDVIVDLDALDSLPERAQRSGLAEVLKMGLIGDAGLFAAIAGGAALDVDHVARALALKIAVVAADPYERDRRKTLNLGHTLGHALETASDYRLSHGEAVAIGIAAAARVSVARAWLAPAVGTRVIDALRGVGLPTEAAPDLLAAARPLIARDKKSDATSLDFIALRDVGHVSVERIELDVIAEELARSGGAP